MRSSTTARTLAGTTTSDLFLDRYSDRAAQSDPPVQSARQLRILLDILAAVDLRPASRWDRALQFVVLLLVVKLGLLSAAILLGYAMAPATAPLAPTVHGLMFGGFGLAGVWLLAGGRGDSRARHLGAFFVIVAMAFAREAGRELNRNLSAASLLPVSTLLALNCDALLPVFLWSFAREFPTRTVGTLSRRIASAALLASTVAAVGLCFMDGIASVKQMWWNADFSVAGRSNAYWFMTFGLTVCAFPFMLARGRGAAGVERIRANWLGASLIVGLAPLLLEVLTEAASPTFQRWAQSTSVRPVLGAVLFSFCLTIPASCAYAIVWKRVLDVRVVLRRALKCALVKYAFMGSSAAPLLGVAWVLYSHRDHAVSQLLADPLTRSLCALTIVGVVCLACAERVLARVDALFFSAPYDPRAILREAGPRLSRAADGSAIAEVLKNEIMCAFAPSAISVVIKSDGSYSEPGSSRQVLSNDSPLVDVLARARRSADVAVTDELLRSVSPGDAAWLARACADLVVPLRSADGAILGIVAVAERADGRPYYAEDQLLVVDLAALAALSLEREQLRREHSRPSAVLEEYSEPAFECPGCGAVVPAATASRCDDCSGPLDRCQLPRVVNRKFLVRRRLGRGGMGIVYLAEDVMLQRSVALKTLPYVSAAGARRCREEAQAMARVSHPNLATIYGFDTCDDRPILVVEYLEGGTLADRLRGRRSVVADVVDWGLALCDGLTCLHAKGLLHGDIKPSNIAFDAIGIPKLLDFGLASVLATASGARVVDCTSRQCWGTRQYRCPEAAHAAAGSPQFDLWSLAAVLYEAIAGEKVADQFASHGPPRAVRNLCELREEVPAELARFFQRALHSRIEARPISAEEFRLWLHHARPVR